MKKETRYENYPAGFIITSNIFQIAIYSIGAYIIYQLGFLGLIIFLLYIFLLEFRLLKKSCVNCYYYGKYCAFGKGKLACLLFKKGNSKKFIKDKITWKDMIPDFMVSIIPIIIAIILLIMHFNWLILALLIILALLTTVGNGFVRGSLACKYCKQKNLGCPAEKLFNKKRGM